MRTTRRTLLRGLAGGAGTVLLSSTVPFRAHAEKRRTRRGARDDGIIERIRADLERHASFGEKFSGGAGDLATAAWIAGRLRAAGYRVEESEFDAPFFVGRTARLTAGSASVRVVPQAPVVTTGAAGVAGPLVLIDMRAGAGTPADAGGPRPPASSSPPARSASAPLAAAGDLHGRIALVVAPFARHAALFPDRGIGEAVVGAAKAGARAVVLVTTGPTGEAIALNAPEQPFVPIPMAVLAPKDAAPFVEAARTGASSTLILDGDATHRPSKNLVARLERGDRWIAISTPRSGWYGCVGERGTGTAAFLELARWAADRFPDLSVFLMNTGGHEYFFAGTHRVIGQAPPPEKTLVWTHIGATLAARDAEEKDGALVMLETADPQRSLMVTEAAREAATAAFAGLSGLEKPVAIRPSAGELSSFTDRGYNTAFAAIGVHRWFHTVKDTLDTTDARLVEPVIRAHQRTIETLVARA
ncbi:MAG TPA: hypothetical protein VFV10_06875 [Gammaproteobacteria bacterium]|nr:hypothetical protein [Gammaproteobacteria bacterium]